MLEQNRRADAELAFPHNGLKVRRTLADVPWCIRLSPIDRRRRQINVLHEPRIDEAGRRDAATDRGNAADAVIAAKTRERARQIVIDGDQGDPRPPRDLVRHFPDALIAREQEHRDIGRGEDTRLEIEVAVL